MTGRPGRTIAVTGGRHYGDKARLRAILDAGHRADPIGVLLIGDAHGADALAFDWAVDQAEVEVRMFYAHWGRYGAAAGPIRNRQILDAGPSVVVAFPGGRGTEDMVRQATEAGVRVVRIE